MGKDMENTSFVVLSLIIGKTASKVNENLCRLR